MTGVRAKGWEKVRNMESKRAVCSVGGTGGQRDLLVHPCPQMAGQLWGLLSAFAFGPMPQTMLAQFSSDLGPSFAI